MRPLHTSAHKHLKETKRQAHSLALAGNGETQNQVCSKASSAVTRLAGSSLSIWPNSSAEHLSILYHKLQSIAWKKSTHPHSAD